MSSNNEQMDSRHARYELRTLLDTSRMLIESHDLGFVLNNLLLISMGKLFSLRACILLWDPIKKDYEVAKNKGKTGLFEKQRMNLSLSDNLKSKSVILCPQDDDGSVPETFKKSGFCALFSIRTSAQHIGYLCIGEKANKELFTEQELNFIENLVNVSAVAIANSQLVRQLRTTNLQLDRRVQEMHTLFDLSKEFNATVDLEPILRIFKFALLGQMFIRSFFFLLKRKGSDAEVVVQNGMKGEFTGDEMDDLLKIKQTVTRTGDSHRQKFPMLETNKIEALIRLELQDEVAIMGVGARATNEIYTESDFNFLSSLGNLAMLSVQKTYLLQERIEMERLEEELTIARTIQQKLLPDPLPKLEGLQVAASNVSSQQVGGDYFDVIKNGNDAYIAIADVTGKGIPASLLMANLQAMLHVLTPVESTMSEATGRINDIIYKNTPSDKFISFFWGRYDLKSGELTYVNAGHNPPLLMREAFSEPELLSEGGVLLGAMPTMMKYQTGTIALECDDVIVMYTDGVSEALSETEEEYGEERLNECVKNNVSLDADGILYAILEDVKEFTNNQYSDDITVVVLKKC
ncbi:MAG: SpoIIE family protein phosphatase [Balneolales bacterium]|nr:SpoIIE family protein phosphatase [Balneolales bacterium]